MRTPAERAAKAAYDVAYRAANKSKYIAYQAAYRAENKDKTAARHAAYHAANKDKIAASHAARYAANKGKYTAYRAAETMNLSDVYVRSVIAHGSGIPSKYIPAELIEVKRLHLRIKRALMEPSN